MKNIELISQYLLNTDEDFNEKFDFLTEGLKKEEKDNLRVKFSKKFQEIGSLKIKKIEKGVITIFGNSEFASEFTFMLSKVVEKSVLIVDADRLCPSVDVHLNIRKKSSKFSNKIKYDSQSGFGLTMDMINKGMMNKHILDELCVRKSGYEQLNFIHGDEEIDNYEYYNNDSLKLLIDIARENYDYCILSVNEFIYDAYTCIAMMHSDLILIPCYKNLIELKKYKRYTNFLCEKQDVEGEKIKYIGFHTENTCALGKEVIEELTNHNYLGEISYHIKRCKCRNIKRAFATIMPKKIRKEYVAIFRKLGII